MQLEFKEVSNKKIVWSSKSVAEARHVVKPELSQPGKRVAAWLEQRISGRPIPIPSLSFHWGPSVRGQPVCQLRWLHPLHQRDPNTTLCLNNLALHFVFSMVDKVIRRVPRLLLSGDYVVLEAWPAGNFWERHSGATFRSRYRLWYYV